MMQLAHGHGVTAHRVLLYDDSTEYLAGAVPFLRGGLAEGEHVIAAVTRERYSCLREELGPDADDVEFIEAQDLYARPGPMFRTLHGRLERYGAPAEGPGVRLFAEQALSVRVPGDVRAYLRCEAAANAVFQGLDASILCGYDGGRLPDDVIAGALQTHPEVVEDGYRRQSERFVDPRSFVRLNVPEEDPPERAVCRELEHAEDVAVARAAVRDDARGAGLDRQTVEDVTIAASEVATNAVRHGESPRQMWSYVHDGYFVCQVRDGGSRILDPLIGYFPPDKRRPGGRGVWLTHQLCDVVEIASDPSRTHVYMRWRLPTADQDAG